MTINIQTMYQYISTLKTTTWRKYYNQYQQADNRNHAIYVTGKKNQNTWRKLLKYIENRKSRIQKLNDQGI